jgi:hypothetical protein
MKNRTHDTDTFTVERPSGMDQETWSRTKIDAEALFARLVVKLQTGDCPYVWCTVSNPDEHEEVHSSDIVELVGSDGTGKRGWWCWLSENIAHDDDCPQLHLEKSGGDDGPGIRLSFDAADAALLLRAIADPNALRALEGLLVQATEWGQ